MDFSQWKTDAAEQLYEVDQALSTETDEVRQRLLNKVRTGLELSLEALDALADLDGEAE